MSAIPIHRIGQLEFRAEWTSRDFVSFHINYWNQENTHCYTVAFIKGTETVEYITDRAFKSHINPAHFHELVSVAFLFMRALPYNVPVIYHLQQLYPEYFI